MKLTALKPELLLAELRAEVGEVLLETITDYFSIIVARLKSKNKDELFLPGSYQLDLDQLAEVMTGLKILSNSEYRETITRDDVGINPNSYKEVHDLLATIPRDGKNLPKLSKEVFASLRVIAPSVYKKTREELQVLKDGSKTERDQLINKISMFASKVNQMFHKMGQVQAKVA